MDASERLRAWDRRRRRSRKWKQSQTGETVLLLPETLHVGAEPRLRLAVLGRCGAERFMEAGSLNHERLDHYLMDSSLHEALPAAPWGDYDAVVAQLSLRTLLGEAAGHSPDVLHSLTLGDEDYARVLTSAQDNLALIIDKVRQAVDGRAPVFFLSFIEPPCSYQGTLLNNRRKSLYHIVRTLNDAMAELLEAQAGAHYIEVNDLIRYFGDVKVTDAYVGHFTHGGLSGLPDQYPFTLAIVKRITHAVMVLNAQAPIKLIITDLDNTLWKGVLAEMDQIVPYDHVEGWPLGYVEALMEFKRRGGLLAISSKNDEGPTLERFRTVWGNRLDLSAFCSIKINWDPKSKNIQEILQETNLLPGNALFIDDNPREIEEVRRVLPDLRTLTGEPTEWRNVLLYAPETQVARISSESSQRTEMIQAKVQRERSARTMDRDSYLRSLEIKARLARIDGARHPGYARAAELINKTNQFNTTGKRWTEGDFHELFKAGGRIVALSAADRFGDNGLIAAAIVRGTAIEQVVMSCRVFGLGLESALLADVVSGLLGAGGTASARFQATGKNTTCATYFKDHGFQEDGDHWRTDRIPPSPDWITLA